LSATGCGLNGSAQHLLEVYSQESENLKSFAGVDLNAVLLCPGSVDVIGAEVMCQFRGDFAPGVTEGPIALAAKEEEIG